METIADHLKDPWAVAPLPDGGLLLTEKAGRLRVIGADGKMAPRPVAGTPEVIEHGQGGMMDVALHPDFKDNGWIYLVVSEGTREGGKVRCITALVRGRIKDNRWTDNRWLWRAAPEFHTDAGVHFGSRIVFDGKGHVFFAVGERGRNMNRGAQDITTPFGKIIRLMDDGRLPEDNPFAGDPAAVPGLWSYGHRNPQGLAFDPRNGDFWETEHGPRGGDELNLIRPGLNYGWPVVTHGMNYDGTPWGFRRDVASGHGGSGRGLDAVDRRVRHGVRHGDKFRPGETTVSWARSRGRNCAGCTSSTGRFRNRRRSSAASAGCATSSAAGTARSTSFSTARTSW